MEDNIKKNVRRILLIRPYFEMLEHELVFLPFEPLGLQYIQSVLLKDGHEVELYDCLVEHPRKIKYLPEKDLYRCGSSDEDIIKKIKEFKPDAVCISGMFYSQSGPFQSIANLVKSVSEKICVIGGGAFPSSYGENVLRDNKDIDFIVIGEGEQVIGDLVANLEKPESVNGVCLRKRETGEIKCNDCPPVNMNLDSLPFPHRNFSRIYNYSKPVGYNFSRKFSLKKFIKSLILYGSLSTPGAKWLFARIFNLRHKNQPKALLMPYGFIITSRGCPNRCSFCAIHKVWGGIYRIRSAKNVLDEINLLVRHGVKEIVIVDDNFTVSKSRTIEICKGIIERRYNIRILTPSGVFIPSLDKEVLEYLYKAGLRELQFGVENGDQEFLDKVIRKNLRLEKVKEIVAQAKEIGLRTRGFFIFGYPGETRATMLKTLRFAFESGMHNARFYIFQPMPGTEAWKMALDMGAIEKDFDFAKLRTRADDVLIETKDFSKEDVMKIFKLAYDIQYKKKNYEDIKDNLAEVLGWK